MPASSRREWFPFHDTEALVLISVAQLRRIPAGHTASPTMAVAEKMADLIKAEHAKD